MNRRVQAKLLEEIGFNNRFTRELPGDRITENYRRQVNKSCYSRVQPTPVAAPSLVAYSREVARKLGINRESCESNLFAKTFSGNHLLDDMEPHAHCYGGHQFGSWAGQLGDGRAINLGEVVTPSGDHQALQLKGAGPTPYSRTADGLAVMRSSVREFLCSEAMHHLGVPTTRALSIIATGEEVLRDMFYDGNAKHEPGAVVCRVAPSFIRFGSFEIFAARNEIDVLKQLADYTIRHHFSHLGEPTPEVYAEWFKEVCRTTAEMIIHWQRVGFVHGVMNTDNMSIHGLTIDYGPYGWLEDYNPDWTPNTTDAQGKRYRFGNQPTIAHWNLAQLANAICPLIGDAKPLETALNSYIELLQRGWPTMMANKLGLSTFEPETDLDLIEQLLSLLPQIETDMTIFFRRLAGLETTTTEPPSDQQLIRLITDAYYAPDQVAESNHQQMNDWLRAYYKRLQQEERDDATRRAAMNQTNPKYVLRNYLAQESIDKAEQGDYSGVHELLEVMRHPYDEQPGNESYAEKRPEWARHRAGCSMLSCSS